MTDYEVFKACVEIFNKACKMRKPGIGCINDVKPKLSPAWSNGCLADSQVGKERVDEPRQEHLTSGKTEKNNKNGNKKNTLPQEQGATAAAAGELPGPSIFYLLTLDLVICFSYSQISAAKNTKPLHPDKRPR